MDSLSYLIELLDRVRDPFGEHLGEVQQAMELLAVRYDPQELNRVGFRLYEKFRPEVPHGSEGWGAKAELEVERILAARHVP